MSFEEKKTVRETDAAPTEPELKITQIVIRVEPKFKKLGQKIQARNVADQLCRYAYDKRIDACLGTAQSVRVKNIHGKSFVVYIPPPNAVSAVLDKGKPKVIHWGTPSFESTEDYIRYIKNVAKHMREKGITVAIQE